MCRVLTLLAICFFSSSTSRVPRPSSYHRTDLLCFKRCVSLPIETLSPAIKPHVWFVRSVCTSPNPSMNLSFQDMRLPNRTSPAIYPADIAHHIHFLLAGSATKTIPQLRLMVRYNLLPHCLIAIQRFFACFYAPVSPRKPLLLRRQKAVPVRPQMPAI